MLWIESQIVCDMEDCIRDTLYDDIDVYCPHANEIFKKRGYYNRSQYVDQIESSSRIKVNDEYVEILCKDFEQFAELSKCCVRIEIKGKKTWFKIRDSLYQSSSKIRLNLKRCKEKFNPVIDRNTELKGYLAPSKGGRKRNPLAGCN